MLRSSSQKTPFLSDPHRNHVFTDPELWAGALKDILRFRELEAKKDKATPYRTINSVIESGSIHVVAIDAPTPFRVTKYEHDSATIYMPYRAFTQWRDEERKLDINSGEGILYFAPGTDVTVDTVDSAGIVTIVERATLIEKAVSLSRGGIGASTIARRISRSTKFRTSDNTVKHLVESLYNCYWTMDGIYKAGEEALRRVMFDDTFLRILALLLFPELRFNREKAESFGGKLIIMKELEEWIVNNLHKQLTLTALEQQCNYTARTIHNYFCSRYNISPKQWIIKQRMNKALKLIADGESDSLLEIAHKCGYHDQSRFTSHFEREYGILPKDCKKVRLLNFSLAD